MSKEEVLARLRSLHERSQRAIDLLRQTKFSIKELAELRQLVPQIKKEIRAEYKRMSPISFQENMAPQEGAFYFPAIQDAWADTGLRELRSELKPNLEWYSTLEAVNAKIGQYLRELEQNT
jgi:hypothetical protein